MNRVAWVGLALFLLAMIGVPSARADSYKPAITSEGGYFHSMAAFRDVSFDMTPEAGRQSAHRMARWDHRAEAGSNTGDNNDQGGNNNDQGSMGTTSGTGSGSGTGSCGCSTSSPPTTTATAATPEPSAVILMLFGIGLLFLTRKRFLPSVRNT